MDFSIFISFQQLLLFSSFLFILTSVWFFVTKKEKWSLLFLFSGTLVLGLFMGILSPYLNYWDEQYHALVAKNMMSHPFVPMLYKNPVLSYSYDCWVGNHVWLHKQPLFLWQMALSMKIFGTSVIAMRFPSILMNAIMTLFIYRIGKLMVNNRVGFYAAVFYAVNNYVLEIVSGFNGTDHNDLAFLFYVTASIWAWTEYVEKRKLKWIILIGVFVGAAILNKWLVGFLVFGGWGISILLNNQERFQLRPYLDAFFAFFVSLLVFVPWQIYTFIRFPDEAKYEYDLNVLHFSTPVEQHSGDWKYHFQHINSIYGDGELIPWTLLFGFVILLFVMKNNRYRIFSIVSVFGVYGFYTMAATKMISFPIIVISFAMISFAVIFHHLQKLAERVIKNPNISSLFIVLILLFFSWLSLNIEVVKKNHTSSKNYHNGYKYIKDKELLVFDYIMQKQPDTSYTFFNLPYMSQVPFMFHKGVHAAYDFVPNQEQYEELKKNKQKIVFIDNNQNNIPDYILSDSTAQIIRNPYW